MGDYKLFNIRGQGIDPDDDSSVQQLQAEFSLEAVKAIIQEAIDDEDPDQIALLWAAYLVGFNRSQIARAEGAGDAVRLEFTSAKDREAALELYRNETAAN